MKRIGQSLYRRIIKNWETTLIGIVILILAFSGLLDDVFAYVDQIAKGLAATIQSVMGLLTAYFMLKQNEKKLEAELHEKEKAKDDETLAHDFERHTDR